MPQYSKEVISEKTLILWLVISSATTGLCVFIGAVAVYFIHDCWPLGAIVHKGGSCLNKVEPFVLQFLPLAFGITIGTVLTIKINKSKSRDGK